MKKSIAILSSALFLVSLQAIPWAWAQEDPEVPWRADQTKGVTEVEMQAPALKAGAGGQMRAPTATQPGLQPGATGSSPVQLNEPAHPMHPK